MNRYSTILATIEKQLQIFGKWSKCIRQTKDSRNGFLEKEILYKRFSFYAFNILSLE